MRAQMCKSLCFRFQGSNFCFARWRPFSFNLNLSLVVIFVFSLVSFIWKIRASGISSGVYPSARSSGSPSCSGAAFLVATTAFNAFSESSSLTLPNMDLIVAAISSSCATQSFQPVLWWTQSSQAVHRQWSNLSQRRCPKISTPRRHHRRCCSASELLELKDSMLRIVEWLELQEWLSPSPLASA